MKILKLKCLFFSIFITQIAISQTYVVKAKTLNVREETNKNSKVIGQLNEKDTIKSISDNGDWIKITISEKYGYINKNYLEEIKSNETQIKSGFKYGFTNTFSTSFIIILILLLGYRSIKGRVKDGRRSKGYREYDITIKDYIVHGIYALILGLIIALVAGIYAWVKTF